MFSLYVLQSDLSTTEKLEFSKKIGLPADFYGGNGTLKGNESGKTAGHIKTAIKAGNQLEDTYIDRLFIWDFCTYYGIKRISTNITTPIRDGENLSPMGDYYIQKALYPCCSRVSKASTSSLVVCQAVTKRMQLWVGLTVLQCSKDTDFARASMTVLGKMGKI